MNRAAQDPLGSLIARHGIAIVDGGLATTLGARGADLSGPLWSARVLREAPHVVRDVHVEFLRAGSDVVVTASYQASYEGFEAIGIAAGETTELLLRSVALAREAAEIAERPDAVVAASIGPYGASLADGSEYRGGYRVPGEALVDFHRRRLETLTEPGPDLLAIETLPSAPELDALLGLLDEVPGPPAWVTFTGRDQVRIGDGTPFAEVAERAARHERVVGVGLNCTDPSLVAPLLRTLGPGPRDVHLVVYPNIGDRWDTREGRWVRRERSIDPHMWRRLGADVIGGCCGTSPEDIRALRRELHGPAPSGGAPSTFG